jgi:hypothetical protein
MRAPNLSSDVIWPITEGGRAVTLLVQNPYTQTKSVRVAIELLSSHRKRHKQPETRVTGQSRFNRPMRSPMKPPKVAPTMLELFNMHRKYLLTAFPAYTAMA